MRNVIILLTIVTMLAGTSLAAITNPDGFETYTPGTFPAAVDGWTKTASLTAPVVTSSGLTGNGMLAGGVGSGKILWAGGNTDGGLQKFEFDFNMASTANTRFAVSGCSDDVTWGAPGSGYGAFNLSASDYYGGAIKMQGYSNVGGTEGSGGTNTWYDEELPGTVGGLWRNSGWHHSRNGL